MMLLVIYRQEEVDVLVVGGGGSGVCAAVAASRAGADTMLIDAGPSLGGELVSGINILGMRSSNGDRIVAGVADELIEECRSLGGFVAEVCDFRPLYYVSVDPEYMKVAVASLLDKAGVRVLLHTFALDVVRDGERITGVVVANKLGRTMIRARAVIDCTGDGDLVAAAGGQLEAGDGAKGFQSVTMVFRMTGVDTLRLLEFMRDHPENFAISEEAFADIAPSRQEAIAGLFAQGMPKVSLAGTGPLLGGAIDAGEMYETQIVAIAPVSMERREVSINSTKITNVDATDTDQLSRSYTALLDQAMTCTTFLRRRVPGFDGAVFSGLAPRVGVRETRRIVGEKILTGDDVTEARRFDDGIALGGHPIDVWIPGRDVHWKIVRGGGSYGIPFGCLQPRGLVNLLVAGRCLSATREGLASARVLGTCMATGHAAGTAAQLATEDPGAEVDFTTLSVGRLQDSLRVEGALV